MYSYRFPEFLPQKKGYTANLHAIIKYKYILYFFIFYIYTFIYYMIPELYFPKHVWGVTVAAEKWK